MAMRRTVFFCLDSTGRVFRRVVCTKEADFEKDSFSLMRPETSRNNDQYALVEPPLRVTARVTIGG